MLRSLLLIVLLFGVGIGLSGQAVAEPALACAEMAMAQPAAMAGMADCCPEKADPGKSDPGKTDPGNDTAPCKGMAGACVAMAGGSTLALPGGADLPVRIAPGNDHSWFGQNLPVLYGRSIPPDPYPPSRLG